jgi:hypothetical protein
MNVSTDSLGRDQESLRVVEEQTAAILATPLDEILSGLTDFHRAKLTTILWYAITTLQICHLRAKGESDTDHSCNHHLARLKELFRKIQRFGLIEAECRHTAPTICKFSPPLNISSFVVICVWRD